MRRSSRTTSGRRLRDDRPRLLAVDGFRHHAISSAQLQQGADALTDQRLIVDQYDTNHDVCRRQWKPCIEREAAIPAPCRYSCARRSRPKRSRMPVSPLPGASVSDPRPSSRAWNAMPCPASARSASTGWRAAAWRVVLVMISCTARSSTCARTASSTIQYIRQRPDESRSRTPGQQERPDRATRSNRRAPRNVADHVSHVAQQQPGDGVGLTARARRLSLRRGATRHPAAD